MNNSKLKQSMVHGFREIILGEISERQFAWQAGDSIHEKLADGISLVLRALSNEDDGFVYHGYVQSGEFESEEIEMLPFVVSGENDWRISLSTGPNGRISFFVPAGVETIALQFCKVEQTKKSEWDDILDEQGPQDSPKVELAHVGFKLPVMGMEWATGALGGDFEDAAQRGQNTTSERREFKFGLWANSRRKRIELRLPKSDEKELPKDEKEFPHKQGLIEIRHKATGKTVASAVFFVRLSEDKSFFLADVEFHQLGIQQWDNVNWEPYYFDDGTELTRHPDFEKLD